MYPEGKLPQGTGPHPGHPLATSGGPPQCNGGAPRWLKDVTLSPPPTGQSPRVHLAFKMLGEEAPFFQAPDRSHQHTSYEQYDSGSHLQTPII